MWMAKPCNQPQVPPITFNHNTHTPLVMHTPHHTPQSTYTMVNTHTWLDGGAETGRPHSDDQHTMVSWQPLTSPTPLWCSTPSSNTSLMPSSWWCTDHTHATLCAPQVAWKAWCCACHVLPFHSFHSCPPLLPFSLSVCHWLSLCVKPIHQ